MSQVPPFDELMLPLFRALRHDEGKWGRILDQIEEQLTVQPTQKTRNKKLLPGLKPPWDQELPVWELRVGEYRVFYDVDDADRVVTVRAIRRKPPHATTEEIWSIWVFRGSKTHAKPSNWRV